MRILHVIPQFPWFGGRTIIGGHASCLLSLALAQAAAGDRVTILSYVKDRAGHAEVADGVDVYSLFADARPGTIGFGLRLRAAAGKWGGAHRDDFDLVHCHSGFADYFIVSHAVRRATALPTLHTMYCPIPRQGGRWRLPVVHGMLRRQANGLDALTAMSENVATSMREYGLEGVTVTPPALALDRFHPGDGPSPLRAELGLAPDDVAVLFVGNAKEQKNLSGLLRAFATLTDRHPTARLVVTTELAQSSSDERLRALRDEMETLGLTERVIQRGIVDDMPELMRACDVLAAPFLDSFGPSDYFMAVLEAMACGRPVVVSAVGGMPEVVSDDVGALVDPYDHASIAAGLEPLVADAARRRETGRRAAALVRERFEPGAVVARTAELYARIMP